MQYLILIAFLLMAVQSYLSYKQAMNYRACIKEMMKGGNYVAAGMRRGYLTHSRIVLIACNDQQIITKCMEMKGFSVFERFRPLDTYNGMTVQELWDSEQERVREEFENKKVKKDFFTGKELAPKDSPEMQALRGLINRFRPRAEGEQTYEEEAAQRLSQIRSRRSFLSRLTGGRF